MFWDGGGEQCEQLEISWVPEPSRSSLEMPKHGRMSPKGYEQGMTLLDMFLAGQRRRRKSWEWMVLFRWQRVMVGHTKDREKNENIVLIQLLLACKRWACRVMNGDIQHSYLSSKWRKERYHYWAGEILQKKKKIEEKLRLHFYCIMIKNCKKSYEQLNIFM